MVALAGKPILEHQLEWLVRYGVRDVVLLCGYKASVIEQHFGDGSRFGITIRYSHEDEPLGRGGALRQGIGLVPPAERTLMALNGDVLTDQPIDSLVEFHRKKQAVATVMLSALRSPYGITTVQRDGRITSFQEKPELPYWINAGIYVLDRSFFARLPAKGDHETTTFPELAAEGKLFGLKSKAYWRPVDSMKDLSEAERDIARAAPA